jgi:O-antigen/teichoic acid export membrane protein
MPLTLRQNASWTFIGNVVYAGSQWGMLTVLAKLGSPEMVGQFSLGLAVCAPVIMLANLQLRAIQATDAKDRYLFADYLGLRLITTALALLVIMGIAVTAGYRREAALVILIVGVAKAVESVSDVFYGFLQRHERMDRIAKSMMIKGPLSLMALGVGIFLTDSVLWGVVGLAVTWTLVLVGYDIRSGVLIVKTTVQSHGTAVGGDGWEAALRPRWKTKALINLTWLTLPLGVVMMLISLNSNIPRYFVERALGERELGVFSAMAYLQVAETVVVSALGQSASPRLAKYYAEDNPAAFRMLLLKLIGIGALLGITGVLVAFVAGQNILTLLYRPEYAEHMDVFVWIMVAAGLWNVTSMIGYGATASRRMHSQPLALCAVTAVSFVACQSLVSTHGLWGAAIAMVAGSAMGVLSYSLLFILDHGVKTRG